MSELSSNILILCLDSVRYDTYMAAKTPNMDAIGTPRLVHSFACWTIPTIFGYLMGFPPIGTGRSDFIPGVKQLHWAPEYLTEKDYSTIWMSTNGLIARTNSITKGFFRKHWRHFINSFGDERTPFLISQLKRIVTIEPQQPHFVFMLLMEAHHPYEWADGERKLIKDDPQGNFDAQVKAIEYLDSLFPQIIKPLSNMGRPTRVIITSDHGELFGPHFLSHAPGAQNYPIEFDPKLFEIPLVEGVVIK